MNSRNKKARKPSFLPVDFGLSDGVELPGFSADKPVLFVAGLVDIIKGYKV